MLDYTQQGAAMRTLINGVWIPREGRRPETADPALESLKVLCGLNPQDRQARQQGKFLTEYQKAKLATSLAAQGTASGERVLIQFEEKKISFKSLDELGMRTKLQEELRAGAEPGAGVHLVVGHDGVWAAHDHRRRAARLRSVPPRVRRGRGRRNPLPARGKRRPDDLQGVGRPNARQRPAAVLPHRTERGGDPRSGQRSDRADDLRTKSPRTA